MLPTILLFLLPVVCGGLLAHVLWPDPRQVNLMFKAFLGIGIGLGAWSLSFFVYLLAFAGENWFIILEGAALVVLVVIALIQNKRLDPRPPSSRTALHLTPPQILLAAVGGLVLVISLLSTANYLLRRRQGDWDAWMMYNRAARFVYLDQAHWRESFSPAMDPLFHADYPLLLAMNITSAWDSLGVDTPRVPMLQSALFAVGCLGLIASASASVRTTGQAALGIVLLWGVPVFVNEGAREMADVPLAFFVAATGILLYMFVREQKPGLAALSGITAGLAAWTKNEGGVVVLGASVVLLMVCIPRRRWQPLLWYGAGLIVPLAIVLYFKLFMAPPGDILSRGLGDSLQQALTPSRHMLILQYFWQEIVGFGNWGIAPLSIGILPLLLIYYLVFRARIAADQRPALLAACTIVVVQTLGYYVAYLITPYDLAWHLSFSTTRIVVQIFPLAVFLILAATRSVESVLGPNAEPIHGVKHASGN